MPPITKLTAGQITDPQFEQLCALHHAAFPKPGRSVEQVLEKKRATWMGDEPGDLLPGPLVSDVLPWRYAIFEDGQAIANAGCIVRTIGTSRGEMAVLGLLDVASHPQMRGKGYGTKAVQCVFDHVDRGEFEFCLFGTTEARPLYERMGAIVIENPIVNTHGNDASFGPGFEGDYTMVYSAGADWPEGEIDLRGPGY
jgi:GNAT superfamily N-acetyltransferase